MQIVLDVLYFMNCLPTNIQTNESLYPIQTCVCMRSAYYHLSNDITVTTIKKLLID